MEWRKQGNGQPYTWQWNVVNMATINRTHGNDTAYTWKRLTNAALKVQYNCKFLKYTFSASSLNNTDTALCKHTHHFCPC